MLGWTHTKVSLAHWSAILITYTRVSEIFTIWKFGNLGHYQSIYHEMYNKLHVFGTQQNEICTKCVPSLMAFQIIMICVQPISNRHARHTNMLHSVVETKENTENIWVGQWHNIHNLITKFCMGCLEWYLQKFSSTSSHSYSFGWKTIPLYIEAEA